MVIQKQKNIILAKNLLKAKEHRTTHLDTDVDVMDIRAFANSRFH